MIFAVFNDFLRINTKLLFNESEESLTKIIFLSEPNELNLRSI